MDYRQRCAATQPHYVSLVQTFFVESVEADVSTHMQK